MTSPNLAQLVRARRADRTRVIAAVEAGLTPTAFTRIENGAPPGYATAGKLAAWLGVSREAVLEAAGQEYSLIRASGVSTNPLGLALQRRRLELGWTLDRAADHLGMATSTISRIERGQRGPGSKGAKIADWLGWPVDQVYASAR